MHRLATRLLILSACVALPSSAGAEQSAEELAKATQNPIANLISLPFQNNLNFGVGHKDNPQNVMNIQPVIPISLGDEWTLITRTILPITSQPSVRPGDSRTNGLGDTSFSAFFAPAAEGNLIWGAGPALVLPTATDKRLGAQRWAVGPTAVFVWTPGKWVVGSLFSQIWDWDLPGGDNHTNVDLFTWQYFVNYNIANGWYLSSAPINTANWDNSKDDTWTIPLGGGGGRLWKFEGLPPINTQAQAFYNVEKPRGSAEWQLRLQVQLLFPKR